MGRKSYQALIILCCFLASCVKDRPAGNTTGTPTNKSGVYIACEGQFTVGNASLYLYKPLADSIFGDLYQNVNGQPLGDVLQSITAIDDKIFLAVNHSDKVVVLNASDLRTVATITVPSPRYILSVSSTKAYVSSLYHNKVYVLDLSSLTVTDSVTVPANNTEGLCSYGADVYVAAWDTSSKSIYKIDPATNMVTQSLTVSGYAPHNILVDKEQMLWVLSGNQAKDKRSYWTRIDPSTGNIIATYEFPPAAEPIKPIFNSTKDTLYYIEANYSGGTGDNGIYRMGIHESALPATPFVGAVQYQYFWALGIDPATGYIYVGDPKGFNQKGSVSIYKQDGSYYRSFVTGVGPGSFLFVE